MTEKPCRAPANESGDAVVEATVLFPVMTMIFAALVLISIYLPSQAALQRAVQHAATVLATELSDTWLVYDHNGMTFYWVTDKNSLTNVYAGLFENNETYINAKGEIITRNMENLAINPKNGELTVMCYLDSRIVYKEIIVTAMREYPMPVDLSFIGFPGMITVSASSTAVVQNGDEFIRNIDLATDFAQYLSAKFGLSDIGGSIKTFGSEVKNLLGW